MTLYNLGYSLPDAAKKLKTRHGYRISPSTFASWMDEHRELTTYRRLRERPSRGLSPAQTIHSTKLYHRQVYGFAYHRPKLALLRESPQHRRFAPLADFLEQVPKICPHDLFTDGSRASQLPPFVNRNHLIVIEKENFTTRTAALIIPAVGDNRLRHETLQRFMLANDSVTVAVEIPRHPAAQPRSLSEATNSTRPQARKLLGVLFCGDPAIILRLLWLLLRKAIS